MRRTTPLVFAATLIFAACAPAVAERREPAPPVPAAAESEPSCGCRPGWLKVSVPAPWEWRESRDPGCCQRAIFHIITSVHIEITLAAAPDPGSFAGSVAAWQRELPGLGYDLTDQPAIGEDEAGRDVASLHYRGTGEYGHVRGKIVFRESKTPGTVLIFMGTWLEYSEPEAEADFDGVVHDSDDRPQ